jgi:dsRNA-specific ribonuclease
MSAADLAAARTAATAALGEYLNSPGTADPDQLSRRALALADVLGRLLAALEFDGDQDAAQLAEVRHVLDVFGRGAHDRQYVLERIDGIVNGDPK